MLWDGSPGRWQRRPKGRRERRGPSGRDAARPSYAAKASTAGAPAYPSASTVIIDDDVPRALRQVKQNVGFYVGGMGAKRFNVHKDHITRMGFGEAAERVQALFMAGRRDEAMAAVPDELCDEISLVGPKARIRERLAAWKESPVTMINVGSGSMDTLRFMAETLL